MKQHARRRGFGLLDALLVLVIIGILLALSLPAIQVAREQARGGQCNNNLRQIMLGLQKYHDAFKTFPAGAMHAGIVGRSERMGPSWWYGLLPWLGQDERRVYDAISYAQFTWNVPFNAQAISSIQKPTRYATLLAEFDPQVLHCPSSPVPAVEKSPGPIALPSYVGIAGGCDLSEDSSDYVAAEGSFPGLRAPQVLRPYLNRKKGLALHGGIMTASGMLPPGELVGFAYCVDGTSNTIVVGEQSDWLRNADAEQTGKYHGDAGWDTNGTAGSGPNDGGGFLSGMAVSTRVPVAKPPAFASEVWGVDCYNVTTVRYGLNYKQVQGTTPHPGCSEDHGPNNPLQSAHPGGAHLAFADGAVMAVSDRIDFDVLLLLAIRDDGQRPGEIPLAPPEILPAATPSDSQSGAAEPAGSASEKTALEFVRAAFLERDVAKASTYFDAQAERKTFGKGSAIRSFQQELPHWPPPESLKLREVHFFGKRNLEAMAERFPRFEFTRMAERLEGGLGCLVVFAVKTPDGTERKVPLGFVFQDVAGQMKIVFQDEGT